MGVDLTMRHLVDQYVNEVAVCSVKQWKEIVLPAAKENGFELIAQFDFLYVTNDLKQQLAFEMQGFIEWGQKNLKEPDRSLIIRNFPELLETVRTTDFDMYRAMIA